MKHPFDEIQEAIGRLVKEASSRTLGQHVSRGAQNHDSS